MFATAFVGSGIDDRRVGGPNQLIHNRRRRLSAAQMRPDRGQRHLEEHETGAPEVGRIRALEGLPRESLHARFDLSRLGHHPLLERGRPLAAHEVIPVVQQQEAGRFQIGARPALTAQLHSGTLRHLLSHLLPLRAHCKPQKQSGYLHGTTPNPNSLQNSSGSSRPPQKHFKASSELLRSLYDRSMPVVD